MVLEINIDTAKKDAEETSKFLWDTLFYHDEGPFTLNSSINNKRLTTKKLPQLTKLSRLVFHDILFIDLNNDTKKYLKKINSVFYNILTEDSEISYQKKLSALSKIITPKYENGFFDSKITKRIKHGSLYGLIDIYLSHDRGGNKFKSFESKNESRIKDQRIVILENNYNMIKRSLAVLNYLSITPDESVLSKYKKILECYYDIQKTPPYKTYLSYSPSWILQKTERLDQHRTYHLRLQDEPKKFAQELLRNPEVKRKIQERFELDLIKSIEREYKEELGITSKVTYTSVTNWWSSGVSTTTTNIYTINRKTTSTAKSLIKNLKSKFKF